MQRQELLRKLWQLDHQGESLDAGDLVEFADARRQAKALRSVEGPAV